MAFQNVPSPAEYYPDPVVGRPIFNGKIYIGQPDLDPQIEANQIQVYALQEAGGNPVEIAQPIATNSGGVPVDSDGNTITLQISDTQGDHSIKVLDKQENQEYYFQKVSANASVNYVSGGYDIHDTLAGAKARTDIASGSAIRITDRADGVFDYVTGETANGFDIIDHDTLPLQLKLRIEGELNIRSVGVSISETDNTAAILAAFNLMEPVGGTIVVDDRFPYTTPITLDTSSGAHIVTFRGLSTRECGFNYNGPADAVNAAWQIGVEGVGSSGFVSMIQVGVYGILQDIDGVRLFKAQRWSHLDQFTVRNFNGMMLSAGSGDVFLNTWGSIFLLNGARACKFDGEFNANNIDNIVIENMTLLSSRFTDADPVALIDGIGSNINTMSIENCPPNICLKLINKITVSTLYQENNHGANEGVGARPLIMSGPSPRVEGGNIKLGGLNANQTDFFVFDLLDSVRAFIEISVDLPTPNPTSYQKAITYGTSKESIINVNWEMYDGIGRSSRAAGIALTLPLTNTVLNGVEYIFGMPKPMVGRLLMTQYCVNINNGRAMNVNSNNRPEGYIETNISAVSKMTRDFSFDRRRYVAKYSQASSGPFEIYQDLTLSTRTYLFTSFNFRESTSDPLPLIRASNGSQDFIIPPSNPNFVGWTQTSLVQEFLDGGISDVRWRPFRCEDSTGDIYHGMSFVIDLGKFVQDFGVSFDEMTTFEIASLIDPSYISSEYEMLYRGTTPDFGSYTRGEVVSSYPPVAGGRAEWRAISAITDASVDNSGFRPANPIDA